MKRKLDYLYHYTTAEGLIGIVTNREIWCTSILCMNDPSEFREGLTLAAQHLSRLKEDGTSTGEITYELADTLARLARPSLTTIRTFVCSFSEDPDSLAQWRAYCPHGGYAIGFPFETFAALYDNHEAALVQCIYDDKEKRALIKKRVTTGRRNNWNDQSEYMLVTESLRFKHVAFSQEKEWRLIHSPLDRNKYHDGLFKKYCFRSHNGRVVPYAKVKLPDDTTWAKVKVVVGPCPASETDESLAAVRCLLGHIGPADKGNVTLSDKPYRYW